MDEFTQMQERVKMDNMMDYLIYGNVADPIYRESARGNIYRKRIDEAFDVLFEKLERMFPSAGRDNDELYSALLRFSMTHQETYTEMGFLTGFRFCTNLQEACRKLGDGRMPSAVKDPVLKKDGACVVELDDGSQLEIKELFENNL